ncbi:MAG: cell division protein ZipA C-terminal FtsZ-binding domain-containing protein [Gammaproteobacteria bacterium]
MDLLSVLLLLVLAAGLGLWLWTRGGGRRVNRYSGRRRGRAERPTDTPAVTRVRDKDIDFGSTLTDLSSLVAAAREESKIERSISKALALGRRVSQRVKRSSPAPQPAPPAAAGDEKPAGAGSRLIVLHLRARSGKPYGGPVIRSAAEAAGMRYGEKDIFHHHGVGGLSSRSGLFSLANMFEPGSFDLARLNDCRTEGLVLFMQLPAAVSGQLVFELMLSTALELQKRLGGDLSDAAREPLEAAAIARLRALAADEQP